MFEELHDERKCTDVRHAYASLGVATTASLLYLAFYFYAIRAAIAGQISVGAMTLYAGAFSQFHAGIGIMARRISGLARHLLFMGDIFEFLQYRSTLSNSPQLLLSVPHHHGLRVEGLSFRYSSDGPWVLHNVFLEIRPGERVVIVGENGSGKSTLLKLLCRLYDPTEGCILFKGRDLKDWDTGDYHAHVSAVFQDAVRYEMTARENIGIGAPRTAGQVQTVTDAARLTGANRFLEGLPNGYESLLGTYFDGARQLSAGEWQMVALARGLARGGALLLLDEPTSALDAAAEEQILSRLFASAPERMTVLISHGLISAVLADRVLVLEKGQMIEQGTHAELLRAGGAYARLFQIQSERYRPAFPEADDHDRPVFSRALRVVR